MDLRIAFVGPTNSGKTLIVQRLLEQADTSSPMPQSTDRPVKGVKRWVAPEVEPILPIINPPKVFPVELELIDLCGWADTGASEQGIFARHLAEVRAADVVVLVTRLFQDSGVPCPVSSVDYRGGIIRTLQELIASDLKLVEERRVLYAKHVQFGKKELIGDLELLAEASRVLGNGLPLSELSPDLKTVTFFESLNVSTHKPRIILLNVGEAELDAGHLAELELSVQEEFRTRAVAICGSLEREILELGEDKWAELSEGFSGYTSKAGKVLRTIFDAASQVVYVTFGHLGLKCWIMPQGLTLVDAAKRMHSDFAKNIAGGEVMRIEDLVAAGSVAALTQAGKNKLRSKSYEVQNLDILYFKTTA